MTIWRELNDACLEDPSCANGGESILQAIWVIVPVGLVVALVGLLFSAWRIRRRGRA